MPLKVIREVLDEGRILDRALRDRERAERIPREEAVERFGVPAIVLDRLAELGVLTPDEAGYDPDDVAVIDAIARFRAGGYDETLGFTVYDTLRYREALAPLVEREVDVLLERLGDVEPERAAELVRAGREPLRELLGAMHSKMLLEALRARIGGTTSTPAG